MSACKCCEQLDYAAIVADAMRVERERIIKLLEKEQQELVIDQNHNGAAVLRDVIVLINGENK